MGPYRLELSLQFDTEREAAVIYRAVKPDIKFVHRRSRTEFLRAANKLDLKIVASDVTALRASFNSVARHIMLSKEIFDHFHN